MRRRPMLTAELAAVLLFCLASTSGANLITYATSEGNQARVMVMNDDGTGVTELFVGGKFSSIPAFPSISPLGHSDGTWITFNDYYDIYKIRPDGTEPTLVLCGAGTDIAGNPYELSGVWDGYRPGWRFCSTDTLEIPTIRPPCRSFLRTTLRCKPKSAPASSYPSMLRLTSTSAPS